MTPQLLLATRMNLTDVSHAGGRVRSRSRARPYRSSNPPFPSAASCSHRSGVAHGEGRQLQGEMGFRKMALSPGAVDLTCNKKPAAQDHCDNRMTRVHFAWSDGMGPPAVQCLLTIRSCKKSRRATHSSFFPTMHLALANTRLSAASLRLPQRYFQLRPFDKTRHDPPHSSTTGG